MFKAGPTEDRPVGDEISLHGVFLALRLPPPAAPSSTGVLLIGAAGIGKSELALDLVSRGHALVADDAPLFRPDGDGRWTGRCPPPLQDFLEVRGLGILNVRRLFGASAICAAHPLDLVIRLEGDSARAPGPEERLEGSWRHFMLGDRPLPELPLTVHGGRNLALLVETAARLLASGDRDGSGYNAAHELAHRIATSIGSGQAPAEDDREARKQDESHLGKESP